MVAPQMFLVRVTIDTHPCVSLVTLASQAHL